jgi:hypothetical protein
MSAKIYYVHVKINIVKTGYAPARQPRWREKLPAEKTGPFYVVSEWLKSAVEQLVNFEANAVVSSGSDV